MKNIHHSIDIDDVYDKTVFDDTAFYQTPTYQTSIEQSHTVNDTEVGQRLDKLIANVWTEYSRSQLQDWIADGSVTVNDLSQKPKYRVRVDDKIVLQATLVEHSHDLPENIAIDVIYEDNDVLVVNKPVGLVVHPGAGNWTGTLVNALLYHYPNQAHLPRAGLVHRIDKDTSGLLIIGKNHLAQQHLMQQLKDKSVYRHYQCIVAGDVMDFSSHRTINAPIGRHKTHRTKMAVTSQGKDAITHILNITALNEQYCLLDIGLQTGRTHQIRAHLSHIGHALVGDMVYGSRQQLRAGLTKEQRQAIIEFPRQALHAYTLGFVHPVTHQNIEVTAPLPDDMQQLIDILKS